MVRNTQPKHYANTALFLEREFLRARKLAISLPYDGAGAKITGAFSRSPTQTHAIFGRATDFAQYRDIACALHGDAYRRGLCAGVGRCEFATPPPSRASNGGAYLRL